ncbi:MAG: insulinase family protein [Rhizobiales bacterium]|nr:insulinase family protein [Hyphomicrobiales bacterium]
MNSNTVNAAIGFLSGLCLMVLIVINPAPAKALEVRKVTSPGGISAWLSEDHTIPLFAVRFSFKGGSAADPADKAGLAYFLSGMLDEGAGDMTSADFQKQVKQLNMRLSFSAEREAFSGSLQTLTVNRDAAFDMLRLALTSPRFDDAPLNRVRGQIALSLREDAKDPETIVGSRWMGLMFGDHPYARPIKGSADGLKAITGADMKDLVKRLFARDNLLISVVGDIDEATLKRLLDETFGTLPQKSNMPIIPVPSIKTDPQIAVIERDLPQSAIRFGHIGIKRDDPDFMNAYVMNHILGGGGFGSRLTDEVREKRGLSYSVYSTFYPLDQGGVFFGGAATVNERVSETIDVIREALNKMALDGPTAQELAEAKTYLTGSYALRFDNSRKIAGQLLGIQRQNLGIDYVVKRNDLVNAVTLEDVRNVAKRIISGDSLVITIVGKPKGVKSDGTSG